MELKTRFIISPPFGNWISHEGCTSVLGSLTVDRRPGTLRNTIKSFRKVEGGWVNRIGLRNPGIRSIHHWRDDCIYSVTGIEPGDWEIMLAYLPSWITTEVNLGCPNVHAYGIDRAILREFCARRTVIAKLSPTVDVDKIADMCVSAGVRYLHLSNTLPTKRGGESGDRLFMINLPIVARIAHRFPQIAIIAGGGIYTKIQAEAYLDVGAKHLSLATVWLAPWRVPAILRHIQPL